jgi:hypothetical protein
MNIEARVRGLQQAVAELYAKQKSGGIAGATGVASVKSFGAVGNGVADDTTAIQRAVNFVAGKGIILWFPAGTYRVASAPGINVPSDVTMQATPGTAVLHSTLAIVGAFPGNYTFLAQGVFVGAAGTVGITPVLGSETVVVDLATEPVVGQWILLSHNESAQIVQVKAVGGAAGVWTVTTDQPIVFPFVGGDTAQSLSYVPQNITIDGLSFSGTGDQTIELVHAINVTLRDVAYLAGSGSLGSAVVGYDVGCQNGLVDGAELDLTGNGPAVSGLYSQSNSRTVFRRVTVRGATLTGVVHLDAYASGLEDCWTLECARGQAISGFSAASYGSFDCWLYGGTDASSGTGLFVGEHLATRTRIESFDASFATAAAIIVGPNSSGTRLFAVSGTSSLIGLEVLAGASDTKAYGLDTSVCTSVSGTVQSATDLSIDGWICDQGAVTSQAATFGGGIARIRDARVSGAGVTVLCQFNGPRAEIADSQFLAAGLCLYATVGVLVVSATECTGARGIDMNAGATARIGLGCDFSGSATPFPINSAGKNVNRKQTVIANGATPVAIPWPDAKATDVLQLELQTVGGTPGHPTYTITPGTGFTIVSQALDTSTYEYFVP